MCFCFRSKFNSNIRKGESNKENLILVPIMYFTYCQMWMIVALRGIIQYIGDKLFKKKLNGTKQKDFKKKNKKHIEKLIKELSIIKYESMKWNK